MRLHVAFSLQQKKILFTARTFLLALCRRPYPTPTGIVGICQRAGGGRAGGHCAACCMLQAGASRPRSPWVIWVIWVIVFYCKLALVAMVIGSFGSLFFV